MAFKMNGWSAFTKTGDGKLTKMTSLSKKIKNEIDAANKEAGWVDPKKLNKEDDYLEKRKTYEYDPKKRLL